MSLLAFVGQGEAFVCERPRHPALNKPETTRELRSEMFGEGRRTISLGELIQIKAFFGTSIMAIMKRAEQLNLISRPVYERLSMVANPQRWRKEGEPGDESHSRFRQLVFRAVAEGVISSSKGAAYLKIGLDEFRGQFQQLFV